jgi:hypothetical protein
MKKLIIAVTVALTVSTMQAQTKFGVQLGLLSSKNKIEYDGVEPKKLKSNIGIKFGVFAEIHISNNLYFNPSLNFVNKGGKEEDFENTTVANVSYANKYITNYLELPLAFTYKANSTNGFFATAGPVLGLGIGGKVSTTANSNISIVGININDLGDEDRIKFDGKKDATEDNYHLKALEIGVTVAAGYELKNGLRFQLSFNPNFSDIDPKDKSVYKNRYFALGVGFKF